MSTVQFEELVARLKSMAETGERRLVAIVGAPGAGKSTIADRLAEAIGPSAQVVAMDGFHLDNSELDKMDLRARKGSPETFDVAGFAAMIRRLKQRDALRVPTFNRDLDAVDPNGPWVEADVPLLLVEGNYLLLDADGWRDLHELWDMTVMLDVPLGELEQRLLDRWKHHGVPEAEGAAKVYGNDLLNAERVVTQSIAPDLSIDHSAG